MMQAVCIFSVLFLATADAGKIESSNPGMSIDQLLAAAASGPLAMSSAQPNGEKMSEGDMLLTKEQVAEQKRGLWKRKGIAGESYRWTDNTIPYTLWSGFAERDLAHINAAIKDWNHYTCIKFQERNGEKHYADITNGGGCSSYVGLIRYGGQRVSLGNGCRWKSVVLHELGHCIGFHHEQCRPDRDDYLWIYLNNVHSSMRYNFDKYTEEYLDDQGVAYDYSSIMQYGKTAFSSNGQMTIKTKDPEWQEKIGNSQNLAFSDVKIVNEMYKCGGHCSGTCPSDGFMDKNCVCQCKNTEGEPMDKDYVPITRCDGSGSDGGPSDPEDLCFDMIENCDAYDEWHHETYCSDWLGKWCCKSCKAYV